MKIASFDIGKKNFAFYVEEVDEEKLNEIVNVDKLKRYTYPEGGFTEEFSKVIDSVYKSGKKILLRNVDLTENTDKSKYFDVEICRNMNDVLDEFEDIWDDVNIIIVEKQMSFRGKINTMDLKLGQNCQSYFMLNYGREKKIVEFPAYYKTQVLGALMKKTTLKNGKEKWKTLDDRERKKWSVEETFGILSLREDYETMNEIWEMKKRDDVSDVITQMQAFKYLYFVDKMVDF
jgi:hypothetical protein